MQTHLDRFGHTKIKRKGKYDCLICHRERELKRNRTNGVKPKDPIKFPCKHLRKFQRIGNNGCALCHREREKNRYQTKPEYYRHKAAERRSRYVKDSPEKLSARAAVNHAINAGKLTRLPCEVCGTPKSQGHHEDYNKPLEVIWLCPIHHAEKHKKVS